MAIDRRPSKRTTRIVEEFPNDSETVSNASTDMPDGIMGGRPSTTSNVGTVEGTPSASQIGAALQRADVGSQSATITKASMGSWLSENFLGLLGVIGALAGLLATGIWYASKFDTRLDRVEQEMKAQSDKSEKVREDQIRMGVRLDVLEKTRR